MQVGRRLQAEQRKLFSPLPPRGGGWRGGALLLPVGIQVETGSENLRGYRRVRGVRERRGSGLFPHLRQHRGGILLRVPLRLHPVAREQEKLHRHERVSERSTQLQPRLLEPVGQLRVHLLPGPLPPFRQIHLPRHRRVPGEERRLLSSMHQHYWRPFLLLPHRLRALPGRENLHRRGRV